MRRADLADLTAFVAVVDNLSFRAAASHIGVTPSALSHTMRNFEERLGFRLLNRTTRSVSLTDAGLRFSSGYGLLMTLSWREQDSNPRFPVCG